MAGIANGDILPKLKLIRQVQDTRGRVVQASLPERKEWLSVEKKAVEIVRKGMSDVVNSGGGTGQSAGLSYTTLCGKTGTAQWGPKAKNQRLAWFAGFLPEDNPRYAFAVLYEGRPGEKVSGGRMAAPMVKKFFEGIKEDIKDTIAPPKRAMIVVDETATPPAQGETPDSINPDGEGTEDKPPMKALPIEPLETGLDSDPKPLSDEIKPARALPVGDDEVIDDNVEEP
jgi:penicillin-binding protein 2